MPVEQFLFGTNCQNNRSIHLQSSDSPASDWSLTNDPNVLPAKVCLPHIFPGIVDGDILTGFGVYAALAGRFSERTGDTSQSEIVYRCCSTCNHRYYVIDVKRSCLANLRKSAIFTAVAGTSDNPSPQRKGYLAH